MICDHWQVAVVPFPFMERPAYKRRPALVISSAQFGESNGHAIMAMITSAKGTTWPSDHAIIDLKSAGLSVPCYVRWKVFTLPNDLIQKVVGEFAKADQDVISLQAQSLLI